MADDLDHEGIKALAKKLGRPPKTLIALAMQNDPFYIPPYRQKAAHWFAGIWRRFNFGAGVHIRRIHYVLVSQRAPILNCYGKPYENTERAWLKLNSAARDARHLGIVPASAFIDRRNDDPIIHLRGSHNEARICLRGEDPDVELASVSMPDLPDLLLCLPEIPQKYHVEIWAEKTTQNEILDPLSEQYGCNLITGSGELSMTACENVVERALVSKRPVRILYVSDFDPAGFLSMPVAVARKVEHRIYRDKLDLDIQVRPVVLTAEQCRHYELPRTPIKKTERRAARFEARFGEGATELDALEALHPGELHKIIEREILRYYDADLDREIRATASEINAQIIRLEGRVNDEHEGEIYALTVDWDAIQERHEAEIEEWRERAEPVWQAMREKLEAQAPDLDNVIWPEPAEGDEDPDPLFDSTRSYVEQIDRYKQHQDRPTARKRNGADQS
jgi:hypothetical protein